MERAVIRAIRVLGLVAIAVATIAALHDAVYLPLVCEALESRAAFTADTLRDDAAKLAWSRETIDSLLRCERFASGNSRIAYVLGNAYRDHGEPEKAIASYRRALSVDRRPEIYFALGMAQLEALHHDDAIDSFVQAGVFAPAQLAEIPYDTVRAEAERRIRSSYGNDWIP
jgi:tetratricopeptide (TPR) repeat protein